jgi:hypothetical protein
VISWGGAQGGTGGANAPPACMLKKALEEILDDTMSEGSLTFAYIAV